MPLAQHIVMFPSYLVDSRRLWIGSLETHSLGIGLRDRVPGDWEAPPDHRAPEAPMTVSQKSGGSILMG